MTAHGGEVESVQDTAVHARTSHGYYLEYADERERRDAEVNVTRCAFCGFATAGILAETREAFRAHRRRCEGRR